MTQHPLTPIQYIKYSNHRLETTTGGVITESNVGLTVNGQPWLNFMCTPTQLEALGVGFLFNEAVINSMDEVEIVNLRERHNWILLNALNPSSLAPNLRLHGGSHQR